MAEKLNKQNVQQPWVIYCDLINPPLIKTNIKEECFHSHIPVHKNLCFTLLLLLFF